MVNLSIYNCNLDGPVMFKTFAKKEIEQMGEIVIKAIKNYKIKMIWIIVFCATQTPFF